MAMPKNCDECRIMTYEDTNCISVHELFCGCPIVFRAHPQHEEHRPDYCPLIELPKHGLIDKQMLLRNIADNQFAHSSVGHEEDYAFWGKVWDYINDAPTIIEAEGEDDSN